jgi:hypothetical protein
MVPLPGDGRLPAERQDGDPRQEDGMAVRAQELGGAQGDRDDVALPAQLLGAAADGGHLFVDRMEEWRRALGWSHARFAGHLGISRNYWWLLRSHERPLSIGVAQRVMRERPEFGYYLAAAVRERSWGHRPPGDSPPPPEEDTPGGG